MSTIRIVILGDRKVGKSAVAVRFLTRRFIGEYSSDIDLLHKSSIQLDGTLTDVEVLDTCTRPGEVIAVHEAQGSWADAYVVVYSIENLPSFRTARVLLESINRGRLSSCIPLLLLGNMTDLDHRRQVGIEEGRQMALEFGCQYSEVSAAESSIGVSIAFEAFLRDAKMVNSQKSSSMKRRKSSLSNMSKRLGAMFGKKDSNGSSCSEVVGPRRGSAEARDVTKL